jgi:CheY-like chemotaxis protein
MPRARPARRPYGRPSPRPPGPRPRGRDYVVNLSQGLPSLIPWWATPALSRGPAIRVATLHHPNASGRGCRPILLRPRPAAPSPPSGTECPVAWGGMGFAIHLKNWLRGSTSRDGGGSNRGQHDGQAPGTDRRRPRRHADGPVRPVPAGRLGRGGRRDRGRRTRRTRTAPVCAVVDLHLPDGEGEAIVRKVKAAHLPTCVTVVCTGTDDESRIKAVEALGPDALLRKPVEFGQVFAACQASSCR